MQEYQELQGKALGAVKAYLKQMLLEGRFEGLDERQRAEKAKQLVKGIAQNEQQLNAIMSKHSKNNNKQFFSVR
jgi:transcription termination factor NusB